MDFQWALTQLKTGNKVTRLAWVDNKWWLGLKRPVNGSDMQLPYIYINRYKNLTPWSPQDWDLMADDWRPHTALTAPKAKKP